MQEALDLSFDRLLMMMMIFIGVRIIKEMPGSVASGTHCVILCKYFRFTPHEKSSIRHDYHRIQFSIFSLTTVIEYEDPISQALSAVYSCMSCVL